MLFRSDIGETADVAAQNPDVDKKLKTLADNMAAKLCDGSAKGPGVRPAGRVENHEPLYPMETGSGKKGKKAAKGSE